MDNTTILSWNVRGLNAQARRDNVRTLVDDIRPSIVCLQETKLDVIPTSLILSMLGRAFPEYAYLPASSTRGGILIAGRQADVSFSDVLARGLLFGHCLCRGREEQWGWPGQMVTHSCLWSARRRRQGHLPRGARSNQRRLCRALGDNRRFQPHSERSRQE